MFTTTCICYKFPFEIIRRTKRGAGGKEKEEMEEREDSNESGSRLIDLLGHFDSRRSNFSAREPLSIRCSTDGQRKKEKKTRSSVLRSTNHCSRYREASVVAS